ncbi:putative metal ion transporter YfjQ [uncultured Sphingopyxis sp.]|uniref:Putative metal ion transporter YfjQ n=1 Tax=uncultured Sphingopyxis sp. TaxID=310581 RepID=A0A1Y5PYJ9_9SPHN|nr:magnesium and cobalt transport protein CorA [uncultured Sphingopyxis sp.]SBV32304.1 putative metal ion transporter YfjQ [uncultured Sphingopyxis sp.]
MSIVAAIHGGDEKPRWSAWEGAAPVPERGFVWIDVVDPEGEEIGRLQRAFGLHELAVEDSMSLSQLAKVDLYADHVFIVAKAAELGADEILYTDVSIFLAEGRVITVCRMETAFGHRLRERIDRIAARKVKGPEYVVHDVLDLIVDDYFPIVQMIADEVLRMERRLLDDSLGRDEIALIFQLRRETVHFKHVLTRMGDVCNKLASLDVPCVSAGAQPYFRDVLDHLTRIDAMSDGLIDVIRTAMEASSLLEEQRQSAITRQLAAWAGILAIPTAITGFYGMNFIAAPRPPATWDALLLFGAIIAICGFLYWRFRRLGWLQSGGRQSARRRRKDGFYRGSGPRAM